MNRISKSIFSGIATFAFVAVAAAQSKQDGIRAIDVEQYEKAKSIFTSLINSSPSDASNYYYLGDAYLNTDQADSAKLFFTRGISIDAAHSYSYIGLGKLQLANGGGQAAAKINFEKAVELAPGDALTFLYIGEAYTEAEKKDLAEALQYLNKALSIDSKNPDIYVAIGDVYLEQNNGTEAIKNYDKCLSLNPKYVKAHVRVGRVYTRALNYQVAKASFDKAIEIDPNYPPIYRDLGELEFIAKRYEAAIQNYKQFVELTDNSVNTRVRYASFLFINKEYRQTAEVIKSLMTRDTSRVLMYRLLGYSSYELKDYKTGLPAMEKFFARSEAKRIIPSDYGYLGKLQVKNGQDSLGIANIKKAIELTPGEPDLYSDLADAYISAKKFKEAVLAYEQKFEMKKPSSADYFLYGRAQMFAGEYVKADSAFAQVNRFSPTFIIGYVYRGRTSSAIDSTADLGLAKPHYEKVIELASEDAVKNKKELIEAYRYLGVYYIKKDNYALAKEYWVKLKELDPTDKEATEMLNNPEMKKL